MGYRWHLVRKTTRLAHAAAATALLLGFTASAPASAQNDAAINAGEPATAEGWTIPRLADGRPDLQGVWTNKTIIPVERPEELGNQAFFTPEEARAFAERRLERSDRDNRDDGVRDVINAYNAFWWDSGTEVLANMRTSIIVDPPNGRIPPLTPRRQAELEAQQQAIEERCERPGCAITNSGELAPADEPESLGLMTRCISFGTVVPMLPTAYNNNYQIVQSQNELAILTEMVHQTRTIPTDGGSPLPSSVRQWFGDQHGHWEGDTLIVESTNFKGEMHGRLAAADENLRVTERFTRVGPDTLLYRFTVDDPTAWTQPWSGEIPLRKVDGLLYEYACHEGNRGMQNILRAARKEMREAEDGRTSPSAD